MTPQVNIFTPSNSENFASDTKHEEKERKEFDYDVSITREQGLCDFRVVFSLESYT